MEEYIGLESKIKPFLFLAYNLSILGFMKQEMFGVLIFEVLWLLVWLVGVFLLVQIQGIVLQCKTTNNMLSFKVV